MFKLVKTRAMGQDVYRIKSSTQSEDQFINEFVSVFGVIKKLKFMYTTSMSISNKRELKNCDCVLIHDFFMDNVRNLKAIYVNDNEIPIYLDWADNYSDTQSALELMESMNYERIFEMNERLRLAEVDDYIKKCRSRVCC